jgi:2-polyprenyl-6-methoxyphenol hydroxylase-like FAD-dependent oxidoreductase
LIRSRRHDVVILGGGPAGLTAAVTLARLGAKVALFDATPEARDLGRIETVQARLKPVLAEIGALARIGAAGATAAPATLSTWFARLEHERPSIRDPYGPPLHISRGMFRSVLAELAVEAGAYLSVGQQLRASRGPLGWQLACGSAVIEAPFLVVATGRAAVPIAARIGQRLVDRLVAIVGSGQDVDAGCDARLVVEAAAEGWWYRCPSGAGGGQQIVFLSDSDLVRKAARSSIDWFARQAAETRLGRSLAIDSAVRIVAANTYCRRAVAGDDIILIGDAASAGDPLAGQGLTWAVTSGRRAAAIVATAIEQRQAALAAYSEDVWAHFTKFLTDRFLVYSQVTDWPNSKFWLRRISHQFEAVSR